MFQVVSRFGSKSDMEKAVRSALLDRPRSVDDIRGFLGIEVITEPDATASFAFVTNWTDAGHYLVWHSNRARTRSRPVVSPVSILDGARKQIVDTVPLSTADEPMALTSIAVRIPAFIDSSPASTEAVDPRTQSPASRKELAQLNNQLAVLSRVHATSSKELVKAKVELSKALEELQISNWHLHNIREVLPICKECGKVKAGSEWLDVVAYLKKNAQFLSHGYCPDCTSTVMARWQLQTARL